MGKIEITESLKGSLGEVYYKEYCAQNSWAYTSLEQIYKNKINDKGRLEFKFDFERILIKIPDMLREEIVSISRPSNNSESNPSFVYDFLACKAYQSKDPRILDDVTEGDFRWVEVKTGRSQLSRNQIETARRIKIPLLICRITNVTLGSKRVNVYWNSLEEDLQIQRELDEDYSE